MRLSSCDNPHAEGWIWRLSPGVLQSPTRHERENARRAGPAL